MQSIDIALAIGLSGFSIIMFVVSIYSYIKTKVVKLVPICFAFLIFLFKGLYFVYEVLVESSLTTTSRIILIFDFVIIILIYIAVAKK